MTPPAQYELYKKMHSDFSQSYAVVYKQVMDFYPLPQKFIKEATPEIEDEIEKFWAEKDNPTELQAFRDFFYFAEHFKQFVGNANSIFENYQELRSESGNYIKTVFRLKEKSEPPTGAEDEFVELIPVLNKLITGFQRVKQQTEEAAKTLQKLQMEWGSLQEKLHGHKGSIRPT